MYALHDMLMNYKTKRLTWSKDTNGTLNDIKEALNTCAILFYLNEISPVFLKKDASDYRVGACLFQIVIYAEHPIMFLIVSAADKVCYAII